MILRDFLCLETSRLHLELVINEMHGKGDVRAMLVLRSPQVCRHCAVLNSFQLLIHNCSNLVVFVWKDLLCKVSTVGKLESGISYL